MADRLPPIQSSDELSRRAKQRKRVRGRFAPEHPNGDTPHLAPSVHRLSLVGTGEAEAEDPAAQPIRLQGTLARKGKAPNEYQERLGNALKRIYESGGWRGILALRPRRQLRQYSFGNTVLVLSHYMAQGINDPVFLPKSKWEEYGRTVRPDAEGCSIWTPRDWSRTIEVESNEGEVEEHVVSRRYFVLNGSTKVYELSETEGPDDFWASRFGLDTQVTEGVDAESVLADLRGVVADLGMNYRLGSPQLMDGALGWHNHKRDEICVDRTLPPVEAAAVIAHELGHHFDTALKDNPDLYRAHRGDCETVAQLTAMSVCEALGIDCEGVTAGYLAGWNPEWRPSSVKFAKNVTKRWWQAHEAIMEHIDKHRDASVMAPPTPRLPAAA